MNEPDDVGSRVRRQPKIFQVLPRGMRYSQASATSIDLFVAEVVAHSRFPVEVVAEAQGPRLPAGAIHDLPRFGFANTWRRARHIAAIARREAPSLLVVQQHLPSAAMIQARVQAPVILQRHNFMRPPRSTRLFGALSRARHARQLNALAGLTFVSAAVVAEFERDWPEVTTPRRVVNNGVDFATWRPKAEREPFVLVVGRVTPEKGLVEAAAALSRTLPNHPGWSARFVVSEPSRDPAYFEALRAALAPLASGRIAGQPSVSRRPGVQRGRGDRTGGLEMARAVWADLPGGSRRRRGRNFLRIGGAARNQRRFGDLSLRSRGQSDCRSSGGSIGNESCADASPQKVPLGCGNCSTSRSRRGPRRFLRLDHRTGGPPVDMARGATLRCRIF